MNSMNNYVQLIGSLGSDVRHRQLENGNSMATVSIATREVFRDGRGAKRVETSWHKLVAWGKLADTMQVLLKKGSSVVIQGKLQHRMVGEEGQEQLRTEIVVGEFRLMHHSSVVARQEALAA